MTSATLLFGTRKSQVIGTVDELVEIMIKETIELLNSKLLTTHVVARGRVYDYNDAGEENSWHGRLVLCQELRPEFEGLVSIQDDGFSEDAEIFAECDKVTGERLCWCDDTCTVGREQKLWVSNYLMHDSVESLDKITSVLHSFPPIKQRERDEWVLHLASPSL